MELEQIIAQGNKQGSVPVITTFQPISKTPPPKTEQPEKQP
jgi:hypothetical protein